MININTNIFGCGGSTARPAPIDYSSLSNLQLILDSTGLVNGATNEYGTVDSNGLLSTWKSLAPGPTGRDFTVQGTAAGLRLVNGIVHFDGSARVRNNTLANWDFISYNATFGNLKTTTHITFRAGHTDYINMIWGLMGTNAGSQSNKGFRLNFDDRVLVPRGKQFSYTITKGTAGAILDALTDTPIDVSAFHVLTVEVDCSLATGLRERTYLDGALVSTTVTSASSVPVTTPTYGMDIGAVGNGAFPLFGAISNVVVQSGIETAGTRDVFISKLLAHANYNNTISSVSNADVDQSRVYSVYNTIATAGRYHFVFGLIKSPTTGKVLRIYSEGDEHIYSTDKKIAFEPSLDNGRTFGATATLYDPDGPVSGLAVSGGVAGYSSDGRLHGIADVHTVIGSPGGTHTLKYFYSDDDGVNVTVIDITSIVPSDGLASIRMHGDLIENNGYMYACMYKLTEEGDFTESAQYILRKPVGSSTTWSVFTLRAKSADYINETSLVALDDNTICAASRWDGSKEWVQSLGTNNGSTWSAQVVCAFGESLTVALPPQLHSFEINGTKVIECVLGIKESVPTFRGIKVVYGKASDILASGVAGWNLSTKTTITTDTQYLHYGKFLHQRNSMNAIGAFARDPATLTENTLVTFDVPTSHYLTVKSALGL
jgi:hypothetical protein